MTSSLLTMASTVTCPHAGTAILTSSNSDSVVAGSPVLLLTDVHAIAGCTFAPGGVPSPCVAIKWVSGSTQVEIDNTPVLLQTSVGLCLNALQAPQGTAIVTQAQSLATGT